jgi:hypothetical protein
MTKFGRLSFAMENKGMTANSNIQNLRMCEGLRIALLRQASGWQMG